MSAWKVHGDRQVLIISSDLGADQDGGLDPLVLLAPPILEPDPDDPRVQAGHLHQLLLQAGGRGQSQ